MTGPQCRDGVLQRRFAGGFATTQFLPTVRHEDAARTDRQAGEEQGEKRRIDVPVAADQIGAVPGHRPPLPRFRGGIRIRRELPVRAGQEIPVVISTVVLADHESVATDRDGSPVAMRGVPRSSDVVPPAECHEGQQRGGQRGPESDHRLAAQDRDEATRVVLPAAHDGLLARHHHRHQRGSDAADRRDELESDQRGKDEYERRCGHHQAEQKVIVHGAAQARGGRQPPLRCPDSQGPSGNRQEAEPQHRSQVTAHPHHREQSQRVDVVRLGIAHHREPRCRPYGVHHDPPSPKRSVDDQVSARLRAGVEHSVQQVRSDRPTAARSARTDIPRPV